MSRLDGMSECTMRSSLWRRTSMGRIT
jgi:hypothetical protein